MHMKLRTIINYGIWGLAIGLFLLVVFQNRIAIRSALPGWGVDAAPAQQPIVVLDMAKLMNAQRALASKLTGNQSNPEAATTLAQASQRSERVIRAIAGPEAIVLVKQAVVAWPGEMPDITDAVITELGLPTDVPTVSYSPDRVPAPGAASPRVQASQKAHQQAIEENEQRLKAEQGDDSIIP